LSVVVRVPPKLLANWTGWGLGDGNALAADVLTRCEQAVRVWDLGELRPLPGGEVALVLAARTPSREVVLKLSPRPAGARPSLEGEALTVWARDGAAPEVLGTRDDGETLLLARVRPGDSLGERRASAEEVLATIGTLCARLHLGRDRIGHAHFPSLAEHAREDGWLRALSDTREQGELATLLSPGADDRLLHVDLHALNVLRGPRGWVAIDPKPCIGDPCAEVYGFLDGAPLTELPLDAAAARSWLQAQLARYATASGQDADRLTAWLRIRSQILLEEGAGDPRESLLRLRDALG
jgi:streptomycin 6-kinase